MKMEASEVAGFISNTEEMIESAMSILKFRGLFLPRPFLVRNGRGQHAVVKVRPSG